MNDVKTKILLSPFFLIGLFLLLLNDFFLKSYFHNFLTGKLSDFAGLFVFSLFFIAFIPNRKLLILVFTTIFFTFWKSPFSQTLIDLWNSFDLFAIFRIVDYTDLFALFVLPLAYFYSKNLQSKQINYLPLKRIAVNFVFLISLFAFIATSLGDEYSFNIDKRYVLNLTKPQFETLLRQNEMYKNLSIQRSDGTANSNMKPYESFIHFNLEHKICDTYQPTVYLFVKDLGMQILISHASIRIRCNSFTKENRNAAIQDYDPIVKGIFEREIIDYLKQTSSQSP